MDKLRAILFDLDGVLIDAKDWHYEALNKALRLFGMEISRYDHLVTYDGLPTKKKLEMLSLERNLPLKLHSFIYNMKQTYTMELVYTKCKPVFYHQYALSRLKKENYRLAVCSNAIRNSVEMMLEKAKLIDYIDFFVSNQDVARSKPDPEIYLNTFKRLGLSPKECLIIEDNEKGVKAAVASGAHLMKIETVQDVNYHSIIGKIKSIEEKQ